MFGDFEDWCDESLWPRVTEPSSVDAADVPADAVEFEISTQDRPTRLRQDVARAVVVDSKTLTTVGDPRKGHLEILLPTGSEDQCGDYLAVLPLNSQEAVRRLMKHFALPWNATMTLKTAGPSFLPTGVPLPIFDVSRGYVELSQPRTKKVVSISAFPSLADHSAGSEDLCPFHNRHGIERSTPKLASDKNALEAEVVVKRISLLDFLERHDAISMPLGQFLALLPPCASDSTPSPRRRSRTPKPVPSPTASSTRLPSRDRVAL